MSKQKKFEPPSDRQVHMYRVLGMSAIGLVALGTVIFQALENWSWVDSFYFSVVTVTTVGYGDLTPDTDGAKIFTVFYIIAGISIVTTFLDVRLKAHAYMKSSRRTSNSGED